MPFTRDTFIHTARDMEEFILFRFSHQHNERNTEQDSNFV